MLAKPHRAGERTPIWIPDAAHEAHGRSGAGARATAGIVQGATASAKFLAASRARLSWRSYLDARVSALADHGALRSSQRSRLCCKTIFTASRTPKPGSPG